MLALVLDQDLDVAAPTAALHLAPDGVIRRILETRVGEYTGAELEPAPGDVRVDVQAMPFADSTKPQKCLT